MVDLVTLQTISYMAGALGVCIAAIFYVLNLRISQRNQRLTLETRQAQLFMNLYDKISSPETNRMIVNVQYYGSSYPGWSEFYEKHVATNSALYQEFASVASYFNGLGILMKKGFVDVDMVEEFIANRVPVIWKGFYPIIRDFPAWYVERNKDVLTEKYRMWSGFYYLVDELKKRGVVASS
jgi:hypothetical protein